MFPRSSFFQETGPWLKEKTVWGRIFFKIEEKRKIGNFPEQLRNSFPEKFCCKLDTKTLLSRFPIFIFLPYKGKFVLSVGNLLDKQCLLFWLFIFKVEMINKMYNFCWLLKFWFPRFVDFPAASPIWVIAFLALGIHHHNHHHLHKQQIKVFEKKMTVFLKMRRESLTFMAKHHQHCHPTVWRRKLVSWCELCEG